MLALLCALSSNLYHRILESLQLEVIFKSRLVQLLCNEKGQAQLDQGAYSLIQPQIQSLQGWGINHISGQPVQYILNIFLVFLFGFDLTCLFLFVCSFVLFFFFFTKLKRMNPCVAVRYFWSHRRVIIG